MQFIEADEKTKTIYTLIKEEQYAHVAQLLTEQLKLNNDSRAALSLLGFCNVQLQNFQTAAVCYARLVSNFPKIENYRLFLAQCYYHMNSLDEALKTVASITDPTLRADVLKLKAAIYYAAEDLPSATKSLENCSKDDVDTEVNLGCIRFKEENYKGALSYFLKAARPEDAAPDLLYNLAVCHYKMKEYSSAMQHIGKIIETAIRDHPELNVGIALVEADVNSVGNTWTLHKSALVEAFNLKAAIEYKLKDYAEASKTMANMPPRSEEELDVVTLHNLAVLSVESQPTEGFSKFQFLLQQNSFPPETLSNFLYLCCKHEVYYQTASIALTENAHLSFKCLTQYEYDFINAVIMQQNTEDALPKLEALLQQQTESIRKVSKQLSDLKAQGDEEDKRKVTETYEEILERYMSALMAQAKIFWNAKNYKQVEKVFQKSVQYCSEEDIWKLNVAHTLFMQEGKYKEAAGFYEPIVRKNFEQILNTNAIVLANLCVCYILTNQNEAAEELLRKVEKDEDKFLLANPSQRAFHLCIINLVIGTLYCSKSNFEFGISRIIKAMQPYQKKLCAETWMYVKRCFLCMIENLVKHILSLKDSTISESLAFLEECAEYGKLESCLITDPFEEPIISNGKDTIAYEARILNALLRQLIDS